MRRFAFWALWFALADMVQASQFLDPQAYIKALTSSPYQEIHGSDCCIRCYSQENHLYEIASGTYMATPDSKNCFVLTTAHIGGAHHLTAAFAGEENQEYVLKDYKSLLDEFMEDKKAIPPNLLRLIRCFYGMDIAVAFIHGYEGKFEPAQFSPKPCFLQNNQCSLSGYGDLISSYSTRHFLIPVDNLRRQQCLLTMGVSTKSGVEEIPSPLKKFYNQNKEKISSLVANLPTSIKDNPTYLESIYQIPCSAAATAYENPIKMGFSGATLRDQDGYVIGVATAGEAALINNELALKNPTFAKAKQVYWQFRNSLVATRSCGAFFFFGSLSFCLNYLNLDLVPSLVVSALILGTVGNISDGIHQFYLNGPILPGARSYFCPTSLWQEKLCEMVDQYYTASATSSPQG